MKKLLLIPLMIVLVSGMVLAGCAEPAPTPAPEPAPTPAPAPEKPAPAPEKPAPTPEPEVIKLIHTDHNPPTSYGTIHATDVWLDRIEAACGGRVEIERYYGETLVKGMDAWMSVQTGVADTAWCAMGYWPGQTPLTEVMLLPFLPFKNANQASGIYWKLYEKFPEMQQEYSMVKPLMLFTAAPYLLLTTEKAGQVKTLEDLEGMKIRALGGGQTDALKALGATPMMRPFPDVYMDMDKGVLDGTITPIGACEIFNFHEVGKYMTHITIALAPMSVQMSLEKFNSLPSDIQDAIMSECGYEASKWYGKYYSDALDDAGNKEIAEYAKETGHELVHYTLPPDEAARWQEVGAKPIWDAWIANMEAKGLPGQAVLDEVLKLIETEPAE